MRELDLLSHIYGHNAQLPANVTIAPGDDMGAIRIAGTEVLVTVDQVADGVHFDLRSTSLAKIGRKAMTRNFSDVAAMAAVPSAAVVAGCLPRGFGEQRANELFDAMRQTTAQYQCPLIGGDISIWDHPLLLSVTVLAEAQGIKPVLRKGAQPGDVICVTGSLGGSLHELDGYTHHLDFEPRITLARKLAGDPRTRPHCMIDLSDGLAKDLAHLCRAADVAAVIDEQQLPVSKAAQHASRLSNRPVWQHAIGDGEDYELCFTVTPEQARALPSAIDAVTITQIGSIVQGPPGVRIRLADATIHDVAELGWEHHGA